MAGDATGAACRADGDSATCAAGGGAKVANAAAMPSTPMARTNRRPRPRREPPTADARHEPRPRRGIGPAECPSMFRRLPSTS